MISCGHPQLSIAGPHGRLLALLALFLLLGLAGADVGTVRDEADDVEDARGLVLVLHALKLDGAAVRAGHLGADFLAVAEDLVGVVAVVDVALPLEHEAAAAVDAAGAGGVDAHVLGARLHGDFELVQPDVHDVLLHAVVRGRALRHLAAAHAAARAGAAVRRGPAAAHARLHLLEARGRAQAVEVVQLDDDAAHLGRVARQRRPGVGRDEPRAPAQHPGELGADRPAGAQQGHVGPLALVPHLVVPLRRREHAALVAVAGAQAVDLVADLDREVVEADHVGGGMGGSEVQATSSSGGFGMGVVMGSIAAAAV